MYHCPSVHNRAVGFIMAISDLCTTAANSKLFVHILVLFFGAGAWVAVNGIWVELPIIVDQSPERWELASYLTLITQAGNIGPIAITLWQVREWRLMVSV